MDSIRRDRSASERKRQSQFDDGSMFVSDESSKNNTPERPPLNRILPLRSSQSKRQQTSTTVQPISPTSRRSTFSPPVAPPRRQSATKVKTEAEIKAHTSIRYIPPADRVEIFVGPTNRVFTVGLRDLDKSPMLKSLVNRNATDGTYIMHPDLTKIKADHFHSVFQYLLMDDYAPAMTNKPRGPDKVPKRLDGLTTAEDYQKEALKAGHVYVVAKALGMTSLQYLIMRKITDAQYYPYAIKTYLDLAMIVFSRPKEGDMLKKGKFKWDTDDVGDRQDEDTMEEWLVEALKDRLQPMLIQHAPLFFQVANHGACAQRGFAARIFRRKVEDWENNLGTNVMAIEDDE